MAAKKRIIVTGIGMFVVMALAFLSPIVKSVSYAATATFGNTVIGANVDSGDSNEMNGSQFTADAIGGTVTSMSVHVANVDAAPNNQFGLAIYTDNAGEPGALVASSAIGTLTANAWNSLPVTAALSPNTSYWLVYNTNGLTRASNNMNYDASGLGGWSTVVVPFGSWPQTFGPSTTAPQNFSIYATYTTGPTPIPTATPLPTATPNPTPPPTVTPTPAPTATPDPAVMGQWAGPFTSPVVLNTGSLLPNGKALVWGRNNTEYVWDPVTQLFSNVPINLDLLCASQAFLPDGRLIAAGGGGVTGAGIPNVAAFNPNMQGWQNLASLNYQRWYPTITTLADGKILAISGSITNASDIALIPEVYNPKANTWTTLNGASKSIPLYPFMYLLPNGRVAHVGGSEVATLTQVLDTATQAWTTIDSRIIDGGSSVMYEPGKIMKSGSAADSGNVGPSAPTTYVIDFNQPNPQWRQTASMAFARSFHNLTALPDGNVVVTGGETTKDGTNLANAVKEAEIWNPTTETWATMSAAATPRLYHEIAFLLSDGRVFVSGTGDDGGVPDELNYDIFSPPYLFKGARPAISSVSAGTIQYGSNFFVGTADGASITKVSLVAPGGVTHSTNMSQRFIPLSFSKTTNGLTVTAPANGNIAPPGPYMLFIVNSNGVPSIASWVTFPSPLLDSQPPTAPTNLTAQGSIGQATLQWTAATDNVGVVQYNIHRATTPGFTPLAANKVGQSTTTSFTNSGVTAGTYYYQVTAQDAAGNISVPSNEASAVVTADTSSPTVSVTAPVNGTTVSGNVTVSANATDNVGVVGVQFKLDGANLNAEVTSAPYSTTWSSNTASNGAHTLTAVARDAAANTTTSAAVSVTVSNTTPVTLLGDQTIEPTQDSNSPGEAEAYQYIAVSSGTAHKLFVYLDSSSLASQVVVGLYTNAANNDPGTLLTQATITAPVNGAWNSVTVPATAITAGTTYWIAVLGPSGGGSIRYRDQVSGGRSIASSQSTLTALPATWSSGTSWPSTSMSAYIQQ